MHSTEHRCLRRPGHLSALLPGVLPFAHLKPLRRARGLLVALVLGVPGAGCAVDDAEPGYERVCRLDDQKDRECDEPLPGVAHEAERQCTLEHQQYDDAYSQLVADCFEPLTCDDWNQTHRDDCARDAKEEFGETDACTEYCAAWVEAEDELCEREGSEIECLAEHCIYEAKILANATDCTKQDDCEAYEACLAIALE